MPVRLNALHNDLVKLTKELGLIVELNEKPKKPAYRRKLLLVRNKTVVHWGEPKQKHEPDGRNSSAGRLWGFSFPPTRTR